MNVGIEEIELDQGITLLGEQQSPKKGVKVVHGFYGGSTIQLFPGIWSGSMLQLEAREDDEIHGFFTWGQIKQLRDLEALGLPVTLTFFGRTYQVLLATDWKTFQPVMGIRSEPKGDDDMYVGIITMYRTTG